MNGVDGVVALRTGHWSVFYPANNGREGLFINLQSFSMALFGPTPWALRAVTATMGVLTVIGLFLLVRDLFGERRALIAGLLQAILIWPVVTSRIGFRAQMSALVLVWALWALLRALELSRSVKRPSWWGLLAGVLVAMGLYTYTGYRVVPLIALLIMAIAITRKTVSKRTIAIGLVSSILVALPLLIYFIQNPETFSSRTEQVTVFHQKTGLILGIGYNALMQLQSPFWRGDFNPRHNACSEPFMSWFAQPFFVIGIFMIVRPLGRRMNRQWLESHWRETLIILWLLIGCLPNLLAESHSQPHGLRLMLIQPALALIAALGIVRTESWLNLRLGRRALWLTPILLCSIALYSYNAIFNRWESSPLMPYAFNYQQLPFVKQIQSTTSTKTRYVVAPRWDEKAYGIPVLAQSVAFLTQSISPEEQAAKNIHYVLDNEVTRSDSVELWYLPW